MLEGGGNFNGTLYKNVGLNNNYNIASIIISLASIFL